MGYLSDQVKGLNLTSALMGLLWNYCGLGWLSYYKNPMRDFPNTMPLFQIVNGWFGVILFLTLGMWSKRFKIGLRSQAEENKEKFMPMRMRILSDLLRMEHLYQLHPQHLQPHADQCLPIPADQQPLLVGQLLHVPLGPVDLLRPQNLQRRALRKNLVR